MFGAGFGPLCCNPPKPSSSDHHLFRGRTIATVLMIFSERFAASATDVLNLWNCHLWSWSALRFTTVILCQGCFKCIRRTHSRCGTGPKCMSDVLSPRRDRKSTRLNSSHLVISYAVFCL